MASVDQCILDITAEIRATALDVDTQDELIAALESLRKRYAGHNVSPEFIRNRLQQIRSAQMQRQIMRIEHTKKSAALRDQMVNTVAAEQSLASLADSLATMIDVTDFKRTISPLFPVLEKQITSQSRAVALKLNEFHRATVDQKFHVWAETNVKKSDDILRQLMGIGKGGKDTLKIAGGIRSLFDHFLDRQRKAGKVVPRIDNWVPHYHSKGAIFRPDAIEQWRAFMRKGLDPDLNPDIDVAIDLIEQAIRTGNLEGFTPQGTGVYHRQVFFKDAETEFEYLKRYSGMTSHEIVTTAMDRMVRDTVMVESLGPDPYRMINELGEFAKERAVAVPNSDVKKLNREVRAIKRRVEELRGDNDAPANHVLASAGKAARLWASVATLGSTSLNLVFDVVTSSWNLGALRGNSTVSFLGDLINRQDKALKQALSAEYGLYQSILAGGLNGRIAPPEAFGSDISAVGANGRSASKGILGDAIFKAEQLGQKSINALLRANGTSSMTRAFQEAAGSNYLRAIARSSDKSFKQLADYDKILHNRMVEAGVTAKHWDAVVKPEFVTKGYWDARNAPDKHAVRAISAFLAREVDLSVTFPDMMARSYGKIGRAGTVGGELTRSVMQFQSFSMGFMRQSANRAMREGTMSTSKLVAPMLLAGLMKVQLEQWNRDQPLYSADSPLLYTGALDRSGLLWIAGAAVNAGAYKAVHGGQVSILEVMGDQFGPVASSAIDGFDLAYGATADMISGERSTKAEQIRRMKWFANWIPAHNFVVGARWATRAQTEFFHDFDSTYKHRQKKRWRKEGR